MSTKAVPLDSLLAWAAARQTAPAAEDVRTRFGCSRATAYRWLRLIQLAQAEAHIYKESGKAARSVKSEGVTPAQPRRIRAGGRHGLA